MTKVKIKKSSSFFGIELEQLTEGQFFVSMLNGDLYLLITIDDSLYDCYNFSKRHSVTFDTHQERLLTHPVQEVEISYHV